MKLTKLNHRGFSHEILMVAFVVIFAVAGVGYIVSSHALSGPSVPVTANGSAKDPVGAGPNKAMALEAVKYDTKSNNGKYRYGSGGHGSHAALVSFYNGGTIDCSGFVRYIIWKAYGKDIGSFVTQSMPTNSYFKQISPSAVAAGDIGWLPTHVDLITQNRGGGHIHQFGAHSYATNLYGSNTVLSGYYQRYYRYVGPKTIAGVNNNVIIPGSSSKTGGAQAP